MGWSYYYLFFRKDFESYTNDWSLLTPVPWLTQSLFCLFSLNSWVPKFVRAVKCFRLCRFTWRSSKAGSFTISYVELFPLWYDVLYSDNGMYIQYSFVFKVMLYNTSYFVPLRVSCYSDSVQLWSSSSSILLVLSFLSHPLNSSINVLVFSMLE